MQQAQQYKQPYQQYPQQAPGMQGNFELEQGNGMYGMALQRSRVEDAAMTATGSDIRGYGREQSAKSNFCPKQGRESSPDGASTPD